MPTTVIRARVPAERAKAARAIFKDLGLSLGEAVNTFFARVVHHRGLPYPLVQEGYDYIQAEYGATKAQADKAFDQLDREINQARRRGTLRRAI